MNKIEEAAVDFIKRKINGNYEIAIILGSGLGNFADIIENKKILEYKDIPGFSASTVKGHDGKLIFGEINNKKIVAMKGRIHYYEGLGIDQVVFPIKILSQLGIKKLIVTNAAGGVNKSFKATDLMLITDHINFAGINPAAILVIQDMSNTLMPLCLATITSGTVLIPTASAPQIFAILTSAGVS